MDTKLIEARNVKKGTYILVDGIVCRATENIKSKPGKHGEAKCRIDCAGVLDGKRRIIMKPAGHNVISPMIAKRKCQILHIQGESANVMDLESFETFDIIIDADLKGSIIEGGESSYWIVGDEKVFKGDNE
ncbi:MAG: translation initiation factor IF-5A [DPANN group archaeon]|nr:translation initiation factor IF-5A [DPANN group archaeon]